MNAACADRRGTRTGYNRHRRRKEPACTECLAAEAQHKNPNPKSPPVCGTEAMWGRHRRRGENCDTCRKAVTELDKIRKKAKRTSAPPRPLYPVIHVPRDVFARLYLNASIADQMLAENRMSEARIRRCVQEHNLAA
ncbi:hypothetical protein NONI108955_21140 [Nocardia ninae]|uniref:Uncharacterized protein n=1 Tax=Nocardia ninae NBRC 108245 TaxID=1210091 RepID=A0A511MA00_9NOCA|nr:hypothetical protein [Nocardia ninae]GEM37460.1 hypothetical protein NN4_19790 [Nocardia ninae NBRC 108245]